MDTNPELQALRAAALDLTQTLIASSMKRSTFRINDNARVVLTSTRDGLSAAIKAAAERGVSNG